MNDSELPEAANSLAVRTLIDIRKTMYWSTEDAARAVLVAATERIECPACGGTGDRVLYDESGYGNPPERESCPACSGSGVLFVLKTEKP